MRLLLDGRKLFALTFLCVLAASSNARPVPPQAQASPKSDPEPFAQQAAIVEDVLTSVRLENDGRERVESTARIRIQSESAVRSEGVLVFPYWAGEQTLDIKYVRVRKPDGTIVQTPLDSVQDLSSEIARSAPMYTDQHEKHIAVKALAVGNLLEYDSVATLNAPFAPGQFWFSHYFSKQIITLHEILEISVPKDRPVKIHSRGTSPRVIEEGNRRIYRFETSHLKMESEKERREAAFDGTPSPDVLISSFAGWDEVAAWYDSLQKSRLSITPEIRAKAEELTRDKKTDNEKIHAIYDYVSTQFRYIGISLGQGHYAPHPASEVLGNGFGDCKDKHTLFAALLSAVGVDAYPVLIGSSIRLEPEVPAPALFDHVITAIPQGNSFLLLDTTPGAAPYGLLSSSLRDKLALAVLNGKSLLLKTPADPPFRAFQRFTMNATLDGDGTLEGKARLEVRGDDELSLRLAFRNTAQPQWKDLVQGISATLGFAGTVDNISVAVPDDTSSPFWFTYSYHRPEYGDWPNHRISLPFPRLGLPQLSKEDVASPAALPLGALQEITYEVRVSLPSGFVASMPPPVAKASDFADYAAAYTLDGGVIQGTRQLRVLLHEVPANKRSSYASFSKAIDEDEQQWIALVGDTVAKGPRSSNPEAQKLLDEGAESLRLGAPSGAVRVIEQALKLDPTLSGGWFLLANARLMNSQFDPAVAAFRKAIALAPADTLNYRALASALAIHHQIPDAMAVLRELLKLSPDDRDASERLAYLLIADKKYSDARRILEKLLEGTPDARLCLQLANTNLLLGEEEKAVAQFQQALALKPGSDTLNSAAYMLAEANRRLPDALRWAQAAVAQTEVETSKTPAARRDLMSQLAAQWDTLGWVHFRLGELDAAARFITAAWKLWQVPAVGDHLGQIYEKQGDKLRATHMYSLTLAALPVNSDPQFRDKLISRISASESSSTSWNKSQDELQRMRTLPVHVSLDADNSAQFTIVLSKGPKVDEVRFLSGANELRNADGALTALKFDLDFPDDGPTRLVQLGTLNCSGLRKDCVLVLYSPPSFRPPLRSAPPSSE
jgi:tetratricopeptide (TPR) repeat protein